MSEPLSPPSPGSAAFGRKSSLFSKKTRNATSTVAATVTEEDEQLDKYATINASVTSLGSSPGSPRRSLSLRSHKSQSSGTFHVHKGRSPSLAVVPTFDPTTSPPTSRRRFSRSISASVTQSSTVARSPQKPHEELRTRQSPGKAPGHIHSTSQPTATTAGRPTYHMLAHLPSRRPSEAPSSFSYGSVAGVGSSFASGFGTAPPPIPAAQTGFSSLATYNHVSETCVKRMATLDYIRKVHEGNCFHFGTLSYSPANLSSLPSLHPARLGRRASNYLLLGTSIPRLLELHSQPNEYLRALATLLSEYDTYCSLSSSDSGSGSLARGRMGAMLKSGMRNVKGRRTSTAADSLMDGGSANSSVSNLSSLTDAMPLPPISNAANDFHYLQLPNLPFDPDFQTSLTTLADVLIDAYAGLLNLIPTPDACVPGTAEAFAKADKQLRKVLVTSIANEFEANTRKDAKAEVGGLGKLVLSGLM